MLAAVDILNARYRVCSRSQRWIFSTPDIVSIYSCDGGYSQYWAGMLLSKGVMSGLGRAMVTLCSRLALARASRILGFSRKNAMKLPSA